MSYCRFFDGDVYLYNSSSGGIRCCMCRLADSADSVSYSTEIGGKVVETSLFGDCVFYSRSEAIAHLRTHVACGHVVPSYAFERLESEILEHGETGDILQDGKD